jgi:hypothetical protein
MQKFVQNPRAMSPQRLDDRRRRQVGEFLPSVPADRHQQVDGQDLRRVQEFDAQQRPAEAEVEEQQQRLEQVVRAVDQELV